MATFTLYNFCSVINSFVEQFCSPVLASEVVFFKIPSRQQQRRAKQRAEYLQSRDDELEFSRVPYRIPNKSGRLLVTVFEAGGGGGGGHLPVLIIDNK